MSATITDFEWFYALFLQAIVISGAGIRLSPPATEEERRHQMRVEAGRKAAATRKRNRAVKARRAQIKAVK